MYTHPDARAAAAHFAARASPPVLASLLYPRMSAWADAESALVGGDGAPLSLPLSRAAMGASGAAALLVDAGSSIILYLTPPEAGRTPLPLPPPPRSALRAAVAEAREGRLPAPRLVYVRGGAGDASALEEALLDDGGPLPDSGFADFVAAINQAAREALAD